jgi:hypothetical protein
MIDPLLQAVIRVWHGRGFVVELGGYRLIITAAHCLPFFPPPHPTSYLAERTYKALLGPLGAKRRSVWAECLFADPIADIAVLGCPDGQELFEQAEAYEVLVAQATPLPISDAPKQGSERVRHFSGHGSFDVATPGRGPAYVLSLGGKRLKCAMTRWGMWLIVDDGKHIKSGMSGSPIVSPKGHAIGLVSTGSEIISPEGRAIGSAQNPVLVDCLPGRFLSTGKDRRKRARVAIR